MGTVVSNTSPPVNLAAVGQGHLFGLLYGEVMIPPAVAAEFESLSRGDARFTSATLPAGVRVQPLSANAALHCSTLGLLLDEGEAEALALPVDLRADLVLLDERAAYRIARRLTLRPQGLLGILIEAKALGHVSMIAPLLDRLEFEVGFWLGRRVRSQALRAAGEADA